MSKGQTHGFRQRHFVIGEYRQQSFVTAHVGPIVEIVLRARLPVILARRQPQFQSQAPLDVGSLRPGL